MLMGMVEEALMRYMADGRCRRYTWPGRRRGGNMEKYSCDRIKESFGDDAAKRAANRRATGAHRPPAAGG